MPKANGGGGTKVAAAVHDDQHPSVLAHLAGGQQRQGTGPRPLARRKPLDQGAAAEAPFGQQLVQGQAAAGD